MMTDEQNTPEAKRPTTTAVAMPKVNLRSGAVVKAIIPTTIEEVWQIARMAVNGAMAPDSLLKEKGGTWKPLEDAMSACAIAIMAGAEMGLTPLAALRSYAVVNGRPTLWGDGIKAVVRQSGLCEYIQTGSDETKGWCESKRRDTGEVQRKEFTMAQAKRAGLDKKKGPWTEYPDVMMERRATFRCLNDLYADVLAGIVSAEEAADYTEVDDSPASSPRRSITSGPPEPPPAEDESQLHNSDHPDGGKNEVGFDIEELRTALAGAHTDEEVETAFDEFDVQVALADDEVTLQKAFDLKSQAHERVNRPTEDDGQGSLV